MPKREFEPRPYYLQVRPSGLLLYPQPIGGKKYNEDSLINLQDGRKCHRSKSLSKASRRKLTRITYNWLASISIANKAWTIRTGRKAKYVPVFITLTLPAPQAHTDLEIKRVALNTFLVNAQRKFKWNQVVWKAELQKNGNIHFHIIADRYSNWNAVRSLWIAALKPLGYIMAFHQKHGHSWPPCTQIESPRDLKKVGTYVVKYISKDSSSGIERPIRCKAEPGEMLGRIWGCTDAVRDGDYPDLLAGAGVRGLESMNEDVHRFLAYLAEKGLIREKLAVADNCWYYIVEGDTIELLAEFSQSLYSQIEKQYIEAFNTTYLTKPPPP